MSAPYVAACLANFYGERELEVHAWDENRELCDSMCRVTRLFLRANRVRHAVYTRESKEAAIADSQGIIICSSQPILNPRNLPVFSVEEAIWWEHKPGEEPTLDGQKFQVLRWINKEEFPSVFLHQNRDTPLVKWLNDL